MKDLFLIFVNNVGKNYKGEFIYEFIFSDTTKDIDGEFWESNPAAGRPESPDEMFIKEVGRLESELKLNVVQDSSEFAIWDALDGIVALAHENINDYEVYPEKRLCFHFGATIKEVNDKLYEKDLILNYNLKKHEKQG